MPPRVATYATSVPSGEMTTEAPSLSSVPGASGSARRATAARSCGARVAAKRAPASAAAAAIAMPASAVTSARDRRLRDAVVASPPTGATIASSSSILMAPASARRCRGSLRRHRRSSVRIDAGAPGANRLQSGSLLTTVASVSATSSPGNARVPDSISNSTHPNAQMSARLSTVLPRACSGAM